MPNTPPPPPPLMPPVAPAGRPASKSRKGLIIAAGVGAFIFVSLIGLVILGATVEIAEEDAVAIPTIPITPETTKPVRPATTAPTTTPPTTAPTTTAAPVTVPPTAPPTTAPPAPPGPRYANPDEAISVWFTSEFSSEGVPFVGDCVAAGERRDYGACWVYRPGGPGEPPEYTGYILGFVLSESAGKIDLRNDEFGYWVAGYTPFPPLGER